MTVLDISSISAVVVELLIVLQVLQVLRPMLGVGEKVLSGPLAFPGPEPIFAGGMSVSKYRRNVSRYCF
jgi:hypothetical protein